MELNPDNTFTPSAGKLPEPDTDRLARLTVNHKTITPEQP